MNIKHKIYKELTQDDEYPESNNLREKLFGNNEWSSVDEAMFLQLMNEEYRYHEDMGS